MKIEQKGSLWECVITSGCYSDKDWNTVVVSGNTYEEAKNALKIYYQNQEEPHWNNRGLIFLLEDSTEDERWQYKHKEDYQDWDDDIRWDTDYGNAERIYIHRLSVVYTDGEIAMKSLHLNSPTDDAPTR